MDDPEGQETQRGRTGLHYESSCLKYVWLLRVCPI